MELLSSNFFNTTTQFAADSGQSTVTYLLNPNPRFRFFDLATATASALFSVTFENPQYVNRIALVDHNFKDFTVEYTDSQIFFTTGAFALTSTALTTLTDFLNNSETSNYFMTPTTLVNSIQIYVSATSDGTVERYLGYLMVSNVKTDFEGRVPNAQNFTVTKKPTQVRHTMSNGGTRLHTLSETYEVNLTLDYISETLRNTLQDIYESHEDLIFTPFPTSTGWDGLTFPCVWSGNFSFNYSDNASDAGYTGSLELLGTP